MPFLPTPQLDPNSLAQAFARMNQLSSGAHQSLGNAGQALGRAGQAVAPSVPSTMLPPSAALPAAAGLSPLLGLLGIGGATAAGGLAIDQQLRQAPFNTTLPGAISEGLQTPGRSFSGGLQGIGEVLAPRRPSALGQLIADLFR